MSIDKRKLNQYTLKYVGSLFRSADFNALVNAICDWGEENAL